VVIVVVDVQAKLPCAAGGSSHCKRAEEEDSRDMVDWL
jgi:hypothetical protein